MIAPRCQAQKKIVLASPLKRAALMAAFRGPPRPRWSRPLKVAPQDPRACPATSRRQQGLRKPAGWATGKPPGGATTRDFGLCRNQFGGRWLTRSAARDSRRSSGEPIPGWQRNLQLNEKIWLIGKGRAELPFCSASFPQTFFDCFCVSIAPFLRTPIPVAKKWRQESTARVAPDRTPPLFRRFCRPASAGQASRRNADMIAVFGAPDHRPVLASSLVGASPIGARPNARINNVNKTDINQKWPGKIQSVSFMVGRSG